MRKLISLLVMILLLLSAALAEVSTPTCATVTLATGSIHGGFHREDVCGFPGLRGRKPSGNDGGIPVPGGVSSRQKTGCSSVLPGQSVFCQYPAFCNSSSSAHLRL